MMTDATHSMIEALQASIKIIISEFVRSRQGDPAQLREIFLALSETRHFGFCCDHIATEDENLDDVCLDFCIDQAVQRRHVDCLAMLLMLKEIDDEDLRFTVLTGKPPDSD